MSRVTLEPWSSGNRASGETAPAAGGRLLSVIIVSWNTREVLRATLESLDEPLRALDHEVIVVDNASSDGSAEMVAREFPGVRLVRHRVNEGYGRGCNAGMREAVGRYFLLLNSDARLLDDKVGGVVELMEANPRVGIAGPRVELPDGRHQATARRFPSVARLALSELWLYRLLPRAWRANVLLGPHWAHDGPREVDWLVGACLIVRREAFEATGGFDRSIFMYGEEVEWCRRVREAGWQVLYAPETRVLHLDHQSADLLFGDQGRVDACLLAEDALLRRWEGRRGRLAPVLRVVGATARLAVFGAIRLAAPSDPYALAHAKASRGVLAHYWRRARGRLGANR